MKNKLRLDIKSNGGEISIFECKSDYSIANVYISESDSYGGHLFYATKKDLIKIKDIINDILKKNEIRNTI